MQPLRYSSSFRDRPGRALLTALLAIVVACTKDSIVDPPLPNGDRLSFQNPPTNVTAGIPFALSVEIVDVDGTRLLRSGVDVALFLNSTDPRDTLLGTVISQTVGGQATFPTLLLKRATSNFRIVAAARGLTGITSNAFNVAVGGPAKLAFSIQPSTVIAGDKMVPPPQVVVQDAVGNLIANDTGLVVLQVLTGTSTTPRNATVSAVNGVARFDSLRINAAGAAFTLTAVGPVGRNLAAAVSSVFSVTPGAANRLIFTLPPTNNIVNTAFAPPLAVTATDSLGNLATGFTLPVSIEFLFRPAIGPGASAALYGGSTTVNAIGGIATFPGIKIDSVCTIGNCYRLRGVSPTVPDTARSNFFLIVP